MVDLRPTEPPVANDLWPLIVFDLVTPRGFPGLEESSERIVMQNVKTGLYVNLYHIYEVTWL